MEILFNGQKISSMKIVPTMTIKAFKNAIRNWLEPQGYHNYKVSVILNDGTQLASVVFDTNNYDNLTFQSHANKLDGGRIEITHNSNKN